MKFRLASLCVCVVALICLESGCASFDRQTYHRVGLINLYPDSFVVGDSAHALSFNAYTTVPNSGIHDQISRLAQHRLETAGLVATVLPVDPELFWARAEAVQSKKLNLPFLPSGPDWESIGSVVAAMVHEGVIDQKKFDAVILVGPLKTSGESHYLGQRGQGLEIFHLKSRPHQFSGSFYGSAVGYDLGTLKTLPGIDVIFLCVPVVKNFPEIDSLAALLDPQHRRELDQLTADILDFGFPALVR